LTWSWNWRGWGRSCGTRGAICSRRFIPHILVFAIILILIICIRVEVAIILPVRCRLMLIPVMAVEDLDFEIDVVNGIGIPVTIFHTTIVS